MTAKQPDRYPDRMTKKPPTPKRRGSPARPSMTRRSAAPFSRASRSAVAPASAIACQSAAETVTAEVCAHVYHEAIGDERYAEFAEAIATIGA